MSPVQTKLPKVATVFPKSENALYSILYTLLGELIVGTCYLPRAVCLSNRFGLYYVQISPSEIFEERLSNCSSY